METIENEYYEWIVSKAYFDCYSHEFNKKTTDHKLLNLALYINDGGDLHYAINSYKSDISEYTLSSLRSTLVYYIEFIRTGEPLSTLSVLLEKYLSEYQLISLLSAELKANLNFDFENYSSMKKTYKIKIGGYAIKKYLRQENLTKKEHLISIFKGDLPSDFDIGDINENLPDLKEKKARN